MTGSGGEFLECFRLGALYFRVLGYRVSRFWVWGLVVDDRRIWGCYQVFESGLYGSSVCRSLRRAGRAS